ncbi:hypothetical protein BKA64DRAFT_743856 [Cadophora sp. MPI-SDFR-AT-0126]|nr:hypothetical protein BKA64DRAFT_743856 [Leotiomycetes sp. MPI-SDFR-AT-0126]
MAPTKEVQDGSPSSSIVFTARGLTPDVQLQVFDQVYHVHSVILKMQSAFFFKFLDSPEKPNIPDSNGKISYKWITEIDDDGKSWALNANGGKGSTKHNSVFKGDKGKEMKALGNVLAAMYGQSYSLDSRDGPAELLLMAELADYYCALPAVSRSLTKVLVEKDYFIGSKTASWMEAAHKLKHSGLFRECIIYLAGSWDDNKYQPLADTNVNKVVTLARARIATKIADVHAELFFAGSEGKGIRDAVITIMSANSAWRLPNFYRQLYAYEFKGDDESRDLVRRVIEPLTKNNLLFHGQNVVPGEDLYNIYFLCATVNDEELPWDFTQEDY